MNDNNTKKISFTKENAKLIFGTWPDKVSYTPKEWLDKFDLPWMFGWFFENILDKRDPQKKYTYVEMLKGFTEYDKEAKEKGLFPYGKTKVEERS